MSWKKNGIGLNLNEMKTAFVYSDAYLDYDYGPTHPLKIIRLQLDYELIRAYGLLDLPLVKTIVTRKTGDKDLALFHGRHYWKILKGVNEGHLEILHRHLICFFQHSFRLISTKR